MNSFFRLFFILILLLNYSVFTQNFTPGNNDSTSNNNKGISLVSNDKKVQSNGENVKITSSKYSLAFRNRYLEEENFSGYQMPQYFISPKLEIENPDKVKNVDPYELEDGTYWRTKPDINTTRLYSVLGAMLAIDLIAYNMQRIVWRQNKITGFHSINWWIDVHNYQRMDKIGHFQDAYFVSDLTSKLYRWCGLSGESSIWYGALTGWVWMLEIEISDGLFADWGFSWLDLSSNTIGSGFFILQHYFPEVLGGLHPKFSYHVSPAWRDKKYVKNPKAFIEDYEGMTFWLTVNPYHYFPDSWKKDYPKWLAPLGFAVGYGATDIASYPQFGKPIWYFSLDLDISKIPIGDDSGIFRFIKSELNFLKFPMPTVRVTPGEVWYGLYF